MSQIIIKYKLKEGVSREQYENWTRNTDYPLMRGLTRVSTFTTYRLERNLMDGSQPSLDYIEIFDLPDLDGFIAEDMASAIVQQVMGEFMGFVDNPEFMVAQAVV